MSIKLKNSVGLLKKSPTGFSWTTFLFGVFVPLIRGDLKWFFIMSSLGVLTLGISWLFFPFVYNRIFIKGLLEKGFTPVDEKSKSYLIYKGLLAH